MMPVPFRHEKLLISLKTIFFRIFCRSVIIAFSILFKFFISVRRKIKLGSGKGLSPFLGPIHERTEHGISY